MDRQKIKDKIIEAIERESLRQDVGPEHRIKEDLDLEVFDLVQIVVEIEAEYNVEIDEPVEDAMTVQDMLDMMIPVIEKGVKV